ncbi:hypothetical protein [Streptomyces sp. NPDC051218]|uniref:hypothetical protein n=1 Tax=Streptomyces sp. NPDC051218 TaxID=3365645 RepID=UPI0037B605E5
MAFNGTANFFVIMVESLGPVFLIRTLHLEEGLVGLLLAMGAVGGVAGGVMSRYLARKVGSARISWIAMTLLSLPGLLISLARPGWWVLLFGFGWISWTFASTVAGVSLTLPPGRLSAGHARQSQCCRPLDHLGPASAGWCRRCSSRLRPRRATHTVDRGGRRLLRRTVAVLLTFARPA